MSSVDDGREVWSKDSWESSAQVGGSVSGEYLKRVSILIAASWR